jgi:hypothetical protein
MKRNIYEPVTEFERQTSYCPRKASNFADASMDRSPRGWPLYLAWRIVDEARDYFRTNWVPSPVPHRRDILSHPMGEGLANKLAHRTEAVKLRLRHCLVEGHGKENSRVAKVERREHAGERNFWPDKSF